MMKRLLVLATIVFSLTSFAFADEYCDPNRIEKFRENISAVGVDRLHAFRIGNVTLAGLAVGNSTTTAVQQMALNAGAPASKKSCTWYFNDGNPSAIHAFNHKYVPRPYPTNGSNERIVETYAEILETSFAQDPINMVSCAIENGYVAMGCDGMKHRGPTVFAMLLAFSGCSPKDSVNIVNKLWGTNTIPVQTRIAIAEYAFELGNQNYALRSALKNALNP